VERRHGQPAKLQRAFDFLIGYAVGQRQAAQPALEDAARAYGPEFDSFSAGVLEALRPPDEESGLQTLADLARPMLAELLEELEREVAGDLTDYEHLHQVRITGKRLRYALELCACCLARSCGRAGIRWSRRCRRPSAGPTTVTWPASG